MFRWSYLAAFAAMGIAMPWSHAIMSVSQLTLAGLWLLEGVVIGDLAGRSKRLLSHRAALVFICIWLIHIVGLLWTEDMIWGTSLVRILLPVLLVGGVISTIDPLSRSQWRGILLLTALSVVVSTVVCFAGVRGPGFRDLSLFISHIRLSLMICMSIAILVRFWPRRFTARMLFALAIGWCLFFLSELGSWLGAVILVVLLMFALIHQAQKLGKRTLSRVMIAVAISVPVIGGLFLQRSIERHWAIVARAKTEPLEERSAGGEIYYHDTAYEQVENGSLVWTHVANVELRRAWDARSNVPYFGGLDARGQKLRGTLIRYMASKGLKKDSVGFRSMTEEDIRRVEQGFTNVNEGQGNLLKKRLNTALHEWYHYRTTGEAGGHSLAMRWEFWKTGAHILRKQWLTGVGTGDTQLAFDKAYKELDSRLPEQWRLRAHDQYLTWGISFGVFGLLLLLWCIIYPAWKMNAFSEPLFLAFLITIFVSFITEDTLETQPGATFFGFFYGILVFAPPIHKADRATS